MEKLVKFKGLIVLMTLFVFLLTACSGNSKSSGTEKSSNEASQTTKEGKTLRLGYINASGNTNGGKPAVSGAEGWAIEKGYLQEELKKIGITDIKYFAFPNGPNLNEAVAAGEIDLGIFGDTPSLLARSSGQKTRLIGFANIHSDIWLVTNKKNGVTKVEDLKGKTVATSNGSYMFRYLIGLLEENNLLNDVKVVSLLPTEAAASLERGDIQAYAFPTFNGPKHLKLGFPLIEQASKSTPHLTGSSVIVATEKWLDENPKFLSVWNETRTKSVKDLKAHEDEFYQYVADVTKHDLDVVKDSLPLENITEESFPEEGLKLLEGTKKFLVEQKFIKQDFELKDWILRDK
ncbi:ABC transporter substrate-binding protein [Bacillus sp. DNRA2]|uniref:ABC transporter substrate-binding protein n=1 Tax=Bacillus sp. DNRA2 TaxID=2723053 RepID=UPI00145C6514|nr:MetQ/NlpA family ABC transporter substrate-binding protein [Bacillus sp. DNRA2]NMD70933.1 ABC transporter substrate-binding protein [Bacillus sp. DNRA2]